MKILSSTFVDIKNTAKGGSFSISNNAATLSKLSFINISSDDRAACFYISDSSSVSIKNLCCFYCCIRRTGNPNDIFGNAYYIHNSRVMQNYVSDLSCSYSSTYRSDSSICLYGCTNDNKNLNTTKCHGYCGGCICLYSSKETGNLSYSSIVDALDYRALESPNSISSLFHVNIINSTKCDATIWVNANYKVYANECIFIDNAPTIVISNRYDLLSFTNCISNAAVSSVTFTVINSATEEVKIKNSAKECKENMYKNGLSCVVRRCERRMMNYFLMIALASK